MKKYLNITLTQYTFINMDTNQKYNNPSNADIDIIRQQMDILRAKLENQEIVNERIMLSAMKRSMSWIKKYIMFELCLLPVLAIDRKSVV